MVPAVPDIDRYDLACDGIGSFWIELKRELSTGERNRIRSAGALVVEATGRARRRRKGRL